MKKKFNIKSKCAGALAAVMVFSMTAPGLAAYANDYGDPSVIEFDFQNGPDMSKSTYKVLRPDKGKGITVFDANGQAGHPLMKSDDFKDTEVPTEEFGSGKRPKIPELNLWDGYTFDGWYDEDGNKVLHLLYAFQYVDKVIYKAVWKGDASKKFTFTIMNYRDLDPARAQATGEKAWPAEDDSEILKFYDSGNKSKDLVSNTPVSATYRKDIPGYELESVLIKNNKVRNIGEGTGEGTLAGGADIDKSTNMLSGSMPNDNLTVAYRYAPDPSKKFTLTVKCVDSAGAPIKEPETYSYSAEDEISIQPPKITAYLQAPQSAAITAGNENHLDTRGIYSAETMGCKFDGDKNFIGKMPNQAVTITYTYDPDPQYQTAVTINTYEGDNCVDRERIIDFVPGVTHDPIAVNPRSGFSYPPYVDWDKNITGSYEYVDGIMSLTLTSDVQGGNVNIKYSEDQMDPAYWTKMEYYSSPGGVVTPNITPQSIKKEKEGGYTLSDVESWVTLHPSTDYVLDGWYLANDSGSDKTGERLKDESLNAAITDKNHSVVKLYANFEEDPNEWIDLTFEAGEHGSIAGQPSIHTVKGKPWRELSVPTPQPETHYRFAGWFDQTGHQVDPQTQTVEATQTYVARFVPESSDDELAMPDARGAVADDGNGKITVSGANGERKYAVTDESRRIVAFMSGIQLQDKDFTGLPPCAAYYVYELARAAEPVIGSVLPDSLDERYVGPPAHVIVAALGSNYETGADAAENTMKLTVNPAPQGTLYAILDIDENVIHVPGADEEGWVSAGSDGSGVVLGNLEPNQLYVIVAKQEGDTQTPAEKWLMGTQAAVIDEGKEEETYKISLTNGGYIEKIERKGKAVETEEHAVSAMVEKGDHITISADPAGDNGQGFSHWDTLIGNIPGLISAQNHQKITMPGQNIVLQAAYNAPSGDATASNASVTYEPKDGKTALDLSGDRQKELVGSLTDNAEDRDAIANGIHVEYTVKFNRSQPKATATDSNAVMAELGEGGDSVKMRWKLNSTLARKVQGTNKKLPENGNSTPNIRVYTEIDRSMLGNLDYRLWEIENNGDQLQCSEVPMEPDPNAADGVFNGTVAFDAKVGLSYILTYSKACDVTIFGRKKSDKERKCVPINFKVKSGTSLSDSDDFNSLDIFDGYKDPRTGIDYEYKGLKISGKPSLYDINSPVTKPITLYVVYQQADDSKWQAAHKLLIDEIAEAWALEGNGSVSEENRQLLRDAVPVAQGVADRLPRPEVAELNQAYETLKDLVDSIRSGSDPVDPVDPDNPDDPDTPDDSGTGGGGSGGGSSMRNMGQGNALNSHITYYNGTDGNWEKVGEEPDRWAFVLKSGQRVKDRWADVENGDTRYTYHFGPEGIMDTGWYFDPNGLWYYLETRQGGMQGSLQTGWYFDPQALKWYYLNQFTGWMLTGWQNIGGDWYFLNPKSLDGRPLGSLYTNEQTPDGYPVDGNGRWVRETP